MITGVERSGPVPEVMIVAEQLVREIKEKGRTDFSPPYFCLGALVERDSKATHIRAKKGSKSEAGLQLMTSPGYCSRQLDGSVSLQSPFCTL